MHNKIVKYAKTINQLDLVCDRTRDRHPVIADKSREHLISIKSFTGIVVRLRPTQVKM